MELFRFDKVPTKINFDDPKITLLDLLNGPYIIKICDRNWPVYFVGDDDDAIRMLTDTGKTYFSMFVLINTLKVAYYNKHSTYIFDDANLSYLVDVLKDLYEQRKTF